jgi:hypothetical protein
MSQVVNLGVIIQNNHGETFPIALTPQMVSVIQNLIMQMPSMESNIVDPSGRKAMQKESVIIIPRVIEFDWEAAYASMTQVEEKELFTALIARYASLEKDGEPDYPCTPEEVTENTSIPPKPVDPLNPFNMGLESEMTGNDDRDSKVASSEALADTAEELGNGKDVTVRPDALSLSVPPPKI